MPLFSKTRYPMGLDQGNPAMSGKSTRCQSIALRSFTTMLRHYARALSRAARIVLVMVAVWSYASLLIILGILHCCCGIGQCMYVHLNRATVRVDMEGTDRQTVIAIFAPAPLDRARPIVSFSSSQEPHSRYGRLLEWSQNKWSVLGLAHGSGPSQAGATSVVAVSSWYLLGAALSPLIGVAAWRRRRRSGRGFIPILTPWHQKGP